MPLSVRRFPGWKPIKYRVHLILTGTVTFMSLILLNPSALLPANTSVGGLTLKGELCKPFDRNAGLEALKSEVLEITNYRVAVRQWAHMWNFQKALLNDTTRYGVSDALGDDTCKTIPPNGTVREVPGNKAQWADITSYPAAEFGSFFPGYCASAREAAKLTALSATCVDEKCGCPRIPDTGFTRFFGIADKELCFLRLCITSPLACPAHTNDAVINPDNYSELQLNATNSGEPSVEPPTRPKLSDAAKEQARTGLLLLLYQIDVASNLYALYVFISLFFPHPLLVFRMPRWIAIKRFLFGAEQTTFIIIFVSSLWIYKYIKEFLSDPDLAIIINNFLQGDPCYLDGKYVYDRYAVIDEICDKLVPLQPNFEFKFQSVSPILAEIEHFAQDSCQNCLFPMRYLFEFRTEKFPLSEVGQLGFSKPSPDLMCARRGKCTVLLPVDDIVFLGNRTICLDSEYAKSRALVAPDTKFVLQASVNLWINTGLLASFLVKIAMTNFSMGLLNLADPFLTCDGKFMWIPEALGTGVGSKDTNQVFRGFTNNKRTSLRNTFLRTCIIWGTIFHLCVYNLFKSAIETSSQRYGGLLLGNQDRAILIFTTIASVLVIAMSIFWRLVLRRKTLAFNQMNKE